MKFLLVAAVVLIAIFLWRSSRSGPRPPSGKQRADPKHAIEMVSCGVCGVHCPKVDALPGKLGVYCTAQHRSQAEP